MSEPTEVIEKRWVGIDMRRWDHSFEPWMFMIDGPAAFFFDFDGVLACPTGGRLFREEETPGEREWLIEQGKKVGIQADLFNTRYLRHLVHQSLYDIPMRPTVFTQFARETEQPCFVLTARSSHHAISNMLGYLDEQQVTTQEVFCLGRSSKGTHMGHMLECFPDRQLVFIDDNLHHVEAVAALESDRITAIHANWDMV